MVDNHWLPEEIDRPTRRRAVTWVVGDDVQGVVHALRAKGVSFGITTCPEMTREGDVYVSENMKVAWFKDPDGNILNIVNR
jgi:hypothetical protein